MLAVGGFTIASFLCGFAPTLPLLIVFRCIQGAAGGCLQPLSQAVLLEAFRPGSRKAMDSGSRYRRGADSGSRAGRLANR